MLGFIPTSLLWWLREACQPNPVDFASIELVREGPVLDVGCATGRHIEALTATGIEAVGIDINPEAVRLAHLNHCLVTHDDIWSIESQRTLSLDLGVGQQYRDCRTSCRTPEAAAPILHASASRWPGFAFQRGLAQLRDERYGAIIWLSRRNASAPPTMTVASETGSTGCMSILTHSHMLPAGPGSGRVCCVGSTMSTPPSLPAREHCDERRSFRRGRSRIGRCGQ